MEKMACENMAYAEAVRLVASAKAVEVEQRECITCTYGRMGDDDAPAYFVLVEDAGLPTAFLFVDPSTRAGSRRLFMLAREA